MLFFLFSRISFSLYCCELFLESLFTLSTGSLLVFSEASSLPFASSCCVGSATVFCACSFSFSRASRSRCTAASFSSRAFSRSAPAAFSFFSEASSLPFASSCCVSSATVFCACSFPFLAHLVLVVLLRAFPREPFHAQHRQPSRFSLRPARFPLPRAAALALQPCFARALFPFLAHLVLVVLLRLSSRAFSRSAPAAFSFFSEASSLPLPRAAALALQPCLRVLFSFSRASRSRCTAASFSSRAFSRSAPAPSRFSLRPARFRFASSCCVSSATVFCACSFSFSRASRSRCTAASFSSRAFSRSAPAAFSFFSEASSLPFASSCCVSSATVFCACSFSFSRASRSRCTAASFSSRAFSRSAPAAFSFFSEASSLPFASSCCVSSATVFCACSFPFLAHLVLVVLLRAFSSRAFSRSAPAAFSFFSEASSLPFASSCCVSSATVFCASLFCSSKARNRFSPISAAPDSGPQGR